MKHKTTVCCADAKKSQRANEWKHRTIEKLQTELSQMWKLELKLQFLMRPIKIIIVLIVVKIIQSHANDKNKQQLADS